MLFNENLRWQKNYNAEFGIETYFWRTSVSLVGFFNKTKAPYAYQKTYTPFSYNIMTLPAGYKVPDNPQIRVDDQTGQVYMRGTDEDF